jgi:6-phosphogluconate dehydrogenase (decarboxylating)
MAGVVSSTAYGVELERKEAYDFQVNNANEIWIDASVSGEGVSYVAV